MNEHLKHSPMTPNINRKNFLLLSLLLFCIGLFQFSTVFGQPLDESKYKDVYRLSANYAPWVLECYAVENENGITRIYNENTGEFYPEKYRNFGSEHEYFWGLYNNFWHFGKADSAIISFKISNNKIQNLEYIGLYAFLVKNEGKTMFLNTNKDDEYSFVECADFNEVYCLQYEKHIIVSKTVNGKNKFGCISLNSGKYVSEKWVDEVIACPRVFNEIAFVKINDTYRFYDFVNDKKMGMTYIDYKKIPIYHEVLGIYDNGIELMHDEQIYSFELGSVQSVEFSSQGDFVYAVIKTDLGNYLLDTWNRELYEVKQEKDSI